MYFTKTIITMRNMRKNDIKRSYEIEQPGWSLDNNKYGENFDTEARIRMIETGRK